VNSKRFFTKPSPPAGTVKSMTISTFALVNGVLAVLLLSALGLVVALGLRIHRVSNEESVVPAAPTPLELHDDRLARAA
jgi:hypothetical protein